MDKTKKSKWSRDWENFDVDAEYERLSLGLPTTFTPETYAEFKRWLREYYPHIFESGTALNYGKVDENTDSSPTNRRN